MNQAARPFLPLRFHHLGVQQQPCGTDCCTGFRVHSLASEWLKLEADLVDETFNALEKVEFTGGGVGIINYAVTPSPFYDTRVAAGAVLESICSVVRHAGTRMFAQKRREETDAPY